MINVNVGSRMQVNRNSTQPFSSHLIGHTPTHKPIDNSTAIKKIQNFSYALTDQIGLGLTSKVFKGKNDLTGKPVAIKCIDLKSQKDMLNQEFLKEEIATLQRIKQKMTNNLLALEAVILTSNNLYIVTEFCEGKDMAKILRKKKTLSEQQAQSVMKQMISGLIHRDLKLSNLFVTQGRIKLADFGFAISESKCEYSFNYNAGSPKYMPPESLRFNRYSLKSDIWSMGVMAYELVYGHAPWKFKDDAQLYELINSVPIQTLFQQNINVSNHYKTFIVGCLKPMVSQRADANFVFNYSWPLAYDFVQGFQQEIKKPQVIKVLGKNFAVFNSANQISYQSKQLDTDDLANNPNMPTQFIMLSQLNYCKFLNDIYKGIKAINVQNSGMLNSLNNEIGTTVQIIMKVLGQIACMQKNKLQTPDFDNYIKTGDWQNLKQLTVRYDIEFRNQLQSIQPPKKGTPIPKSSLLPQAISFLKYMLPQNARLVDKLITFYQIRQIFASAKPFEFAQNVNMAAITRESLQPDNQMNVEAALNRVGQRIAALYL